MKTINEVYAGFTLSEITTKLEVAGQIAETFRRKGASLTATAQKMILEAREAANRFGMSRQMQNAIEMTAAKAVRS